MSNRQKFSIGWDVTAERLGTFFAECAEADPAALLRAAVIAYQKRGWDRDLERDLIGFINNKSPKVGQTDFDVWPVKLPDRLLPGVPSASPSITKEGEPKVVPCHVDYETRSTGGHW